MERAKNYEAVWNPKGGELFYHIGQEMMVVPYEAGATFTPGSPEVLFSGTYDARILRNYDIHPDGQRFLMSRDAGQTEDTGQEIIVVLN